MRNTIAILLGAAVMTACASSPYGTDPAARFDAYDAMTGRQVSGYQQIYIAPVTTSADVDNRLGYRPAGTSDRTRALSQRDIERNAERLDRELRRSLGDVAEIVDQPGPGILTITPRITDVQANRPTIGELGATPSLSRSSRYVGGAAAELEFSENGETIATAQDSDRGLPIDRQPGSSTWSDADRFYGQFAEKTADLIDGGDQ